MIFLRLICALIAGILFVTGYAPFNLWFISFLSVLLFLFLLNRQNTLNGFLIGWIFGLGMMGTGVSWIYHSMRIYGEFSLELAGAITWLFCIVIAFFYALVGGIFCFLTYQQRSMFRNFKIPIFTKILLFSSLWTLSELLRSHISVGFPWLLFGDAFVNTYLAHLAPVGGVFFVSFLGVFTVATLFYLLCLIPVIYVRRSQHRFLFLLLLFAIPWAAGIGLQNYEWTKISGRNVPVVLIQANIPQDAKWQKNKRTEIAEQYQRMSLGHTDKSLLVWPEAAVPYIYPEGTDYYDKLDQILQNTNTALVFGSLHHTQNGDTYNGLFTAGAGSSGITPVYNKHLLVPMGEYIPLEAFLKRWIPFLDMGTHRVTSGSANQGAFMLGDWKIAPSVCYEITNSRIIARNAAGSDFLLTVSNDSWFADSLGPHQHMHIARMRALENQRYLIRSTNNGITAITDHRGRFIAKIPQFQENILMADIIPRSGTTPYQTAGNLPVVSLSLILFLFGIYTNRRAMKKI